MTTKEQTLNPTNSPRPAKPAGALALIIKIGLYVSTLTPLVIGPFSFSFSDYPQVFVVRTIVAFCFVLYLWLIWLDRSYIPRWRSPIVISIFIFWVIMGISTMAGFNPHRSFWGSLEHVFGLVTYSFYFLYFWLLISVLTKRSDWIWLLRLTVAVGALNSLAGIGQKLGLVTLYNVSVGRVSGTLSNPDYFSVYLVLVIGLGVILAVLEADKWLKLNWAVLTVLSFLVLLLTWSRASFFGLVGGAMVFGLVEGYFLIKRNARMRRRIVWLGLSATVLLFLVNLWVVNSPKLQSHVIIARIYNTFYLSSALGDRFGAWETSIKAFTERPILGWGPLSAGYTFDKFLDPQFFNRVSTNLVFYHPHNAVLEVMADLGIVGLIVYLAIWILFGRMCWLGAAKGKDRLVSALLLGLLAADFIQNLALFDTPSAYLLLIVTWALIYRLNLGSKEKGTPNSQRWQSVAAVVPRPVVMGLLVLLGLVVMSVWYQANLKAIIATSYFVRGIKSESQDFKKAYALYKEGTLMHTVYDKHLRYGLIARGLKALEDSNQSMDRKALIDDFASMKLDLQKDLYVPDISPITPFDLLSKINEQIYLYYKNPQALTDMEETAKAGLALFSQRPHFYNTLGRARIYAGDWTNGENYLRQAAMIGPEGYLDHIITYHKNAGFAYYLAGKQEMSINHFYQAINLIYQGAQGQGGLGYAVAAHASVDMVFFKNVAALFFQRGEYASARDVIEKAQEIFPEQSSWYAKMLEEVNNKEKESLKAATGVKSVIQP